MSAGLRTDGQGYRPTDIPRRRRNSLSCDSAAAYFYRIIELESEIDPDIDPPLVSWTRLYLHIRVTPRRPHPPRRPDVLLAGPAGYTDRADGSTVGHERDPAPNTTSRSVLTIPCRRAGSDSSSRHHSPVAGHRTPRPSRPCPGRSERTAAVRGPSAPPRADVPPVGHGDADVHREASASSAPRRWPAGPRQCRRRRHDVVGGHSSSPSCCAGRHPRSPPATGSRVPVM